VRTSAEAAVIDATILIPTHRHAAFLACALDSALGQASASVTIEVFVVGDGVDDDTRQVLEPFLGDPRVRFFDFPKGERHGELHRHVALQEARGEIICYLGDDDVLLPSHVVEMRRLLVEADLAHSLPMRVFPDGVLRYKPGDLSRPEFLSLIRQGTNNFISLTGAAHARATYDRLPRGWRPAPPGKPTDIHMWQQFSTLSGFRGVTGTKVTAIHFPDPVWRAVDDGTRAAAVRSWLDRALRPDGESELESLLERALWLAAQDAKLRSIELNASLEHANQELDRLRAPWWRKVGRQATRLGPVRSLRERFR
jgi:GalNAc5-diNAcBac-PP-undecaprenol beta-1,3-glucosyltransferase